MIIVNYYCSYTQSDALTDLILCFPSQKKESTTVCAMIQLLKLTKLGIIIFFVRHKIHFYHF